jgi:pyruvate/2-oxoglutarate dehydrogenase complex dihydrolipoamide acyltransferase (E2) component
VEKAMRILMTSVAIAVGMLIATVGSAQAPAGSTGACKDGSYTSAATKRGACAKHGGVKDWYSTTPAAAATTAAPAATAPAAPAAKTAAPMAPAAAAPATPAAKTAAAPTAPAAGGGPGQVWVNSSSKVYHCSGDKWYGKTKQGEYMTEAAAKAAGNHPDHGKACS